jgi:hypothetical protein
MPEPISMIMGLASLASGVAGIAKAGDSSAPDPSKEAARAEGKRRRLVKSRAGQQSQRTSVLAGEAPDPQVYRPRLLGES